MINLFVADPHWGCWIVFYFFLGGIAAGAYVLATLIDVVGGEDDRPLARLGYGIALPLIMVCGLLLIVDLSRPTRFWHMLLKSEVVAQAFHAGWPLSLAGWKEISAAPLLKYWSPMSIGSWAITLFGLCSLISFVAAYRPRGWVGRLHARSWIAYPLHVIGCSVGFFVAAYTGSLLTATNQPVWSDSAWIGSLFLCSAASTGLATLVLLVPRRLRSATWERLRRAEIWLLSIELLVFLVFVASLGSLSRLLLTTTSGRVLLIGTLSLGLLFPLAMHATVRGARRPLVVTVAACVLLGGFAMRWGILSLPRDVLASPAVAGAAAVDELTHFGPESGRARGGGAGADPQNHPSPVQPRSKVLLTP